MISIATMFLILFVFPLQSASWCERFNQWLEQEVPEPQALNQHHALMHTYITPSARTQQPEMPAAALKYVTEHLAEMLNGTRSEQLQATAYLQEAIDNGTLTPETRLLVVGHAKQLGIPRDEQMQMLTTLLQHNDHIMRIKALRVAEKEMLNADQSCVCWGASGIALSGIATYMYGPLAGVFAALSTAASLRDPVSTSFHLAEKISATKTTLAKEKTE